MVKLKQVKQGLSNVDEASIIEMGKAVVEEKYGNLFEMYEKITGENPYEMPMRIYPAVHYTMGGLWVDYELINYCSRFVCFGRSKLQRSWCKPSWGICIDAGLGRWLFCNSLHIG